MEFLTSDFLINLLTLTFLEIILGIDNLIFIALVVYKLPKNIRKSARIFGLSLALIIRVLMLMTLTFIMGLNDPLFEMFNMTFSWKDLLLVTGGLFLMLKSGHEIYHDTFYVEHPEKEVNKEAKGIGQTSLAAAIFQISLVDFVFSFDSVITAIGITQGIPNNIVIIVIAITISMFVMLLASEHISKFINDYPSLKFIALSFIFMIGVILFADGLSVEIEKGYLYFALFFTLTVECLNIIAQKKRNNEEIT